MPREGAPVDSTADLVARLVRAGEELPEPLARALLARGPDAVQPLLVVLEDRGLAREDAPGDGYAPIHAARLLGDLEAGEAIPPMLRRLADCDPMDLLFGTLEEALQAFGRQALEPALAAHAAAGSVDGRSAMAGVLSAIGARDSRVLAILLATLQEDPVLGAGLLADYGDPAAVPHLGAALDQCEVDPRGGLVANQEIIELEAAIEDLGGTLTDSQRGKVEAVAAGRAGARAQLQAIGGEGEGDGGDPEVDSEGEEALRRFEASPAAEEVAAGWVEAALRYADEHEGASFADHDAGVLRRVLFDLIPRKVSCEPSAAREIVLSLRAFWTFARDVLAHPRAAACLEVLGDEAIPRLEQRLDDPSLYGPAKAFFMAGHRAGYAVETEAGLREWSRVAVGGPNPPGPGARQGRSDEAARQKKKLRKQKKKAQRRNRR